MFFSMLMGPFRCVAQTAGLLNTKASMSWKVTKKTNGAAAGPKAGLRAALRAALGRLHSPSRLELLAALYFTAIILATALFPGEVVSPVAHRLSLASSALSAAGFLWLAYGDVYL